MKNEICLQNIKQIINNISIKGEYFHRLDITFGHYCLHANHGLKSSTSKNGVQEKSQQRCKCLLHLNDNLLNQGCMKMECGNIISV